MRSTPNDLVEKYRLNVEEARAMGPNAMRFGSTVEYGNNGMFLIPTGQKFRPAMAEYFSCIVSDGGGWEHVSISMRRGPKNDRVNSRTAFGLPTWQQMCILKDLFWKPEEVVVQYHPRQSEYVNVHPSVLHLWRPIDIELPTPPTLFV